MKAKKFEDPDVINADCLWITEFIKERKMKKVKLKFLPGDVGYVLKICNEQRLEYRSVIINEVKIDRNNNTIYKYYDDKIECSAYASSILNETQLINELEVRLDALKQKLNKE